MHSYSIFPDFGMERVSSVINNNIIIDDDGYFN